MARSEQRPTPRSKELFGRALGLIAGGVNSPVRAFKAVGGEPIFFVRGQGSRVWDVDGNEYVDFVGSWGPLILGHCHPEVIAEIQEVAQSGTTFGAPTYLEMRLAEAVRQAVPSMQLVRCVSSGTEATMSALRLARGFTGREKILKIDGGYHGHADLLLVQAGSGAATLGIPGSSGVPIQTAKDTLVVPWNDLTAVKTAFSRHQGEIAALIVEPICGNMGVVPPADGYLQGLREVCDREGSLLVFDEVITGFRVAYGGAQSLYGVTPDLTCLGKIVGGGLPAAVFGGRADVMAHLAPQGRVYQAGTLSGNPLAMAAGVKTLELLRRAGTYQKLEALGARFELGLERAARTAGVPLRINRVGSLVTAFLTTQRVTDYESARTSDTARYGRYFRAMLDEGFYLAPSQFEAAFISLAHTETDIDLAAAAAARALTA
jgi:glutamate-1-semialdehyde 2,1-aminomutase